MTLLKTVEEEEKLNNRDRLKMEKFMKMVKDTDSLWYSPVKQQFICLAAGNGKCNNPYVKCVVEYIFPAYTGHWRSRCIIPFNCKEADTDSDYINRCINNDRSPLYDDFGSWRDDIEVFRNNPKSLSFIISKIISKLEGNPIQKGHYDLKAIIFWNLFLTALDDEIYNNQLSDVIDLAYMLGFGEPMIRDWCHAVEYVLNGNKLGKDCDLEFETVEGKDFFKDIEK